MKAVIQRVLRAHVEVEGKMVGQTGPGFLVLIGVMEGDTQEQARQLATKIAALRVFEDGQGKMNRSLLDTGGGILVVSQFTLCADCRKGNRPSFSQSAEPRKAKELYELSVKFLREAGVSRVETGIFGADMQVSLVNDGPVTILFDTDNWKKGC